MAVERSASEEQPSALIIQRGQMVSLTIDGVSTDCLVFHAGKEKTIFVAVQPSPEFTDAVDDLPASAVITDSSGVDSGFMLESTTSLVALVGKHTSQTTSSNQRQWYRVRLRLPIDVSIDGKQWHRLRAENLSEGGLRLCNTDLSKVSLGQTLMLRIRIPGEDLISVNGEIVWLGAPLPGVIQRPSKLAVQFVRMAPEDAQRLTQFIYRLQIERAATKSTGLE
ncbi:MAG: PilZ domain-containing protein [Armatimonadota bacterium]